MTKDDDSGFNVRYTNRDIMEKLDKIHEQTRKTNGRVTELEKRSIGLWIINHPITFILYSAVFFALVISDIRHPIISFLTALL